MVAKKIDIGRPYLLFLALLAVATLMRLPYLGDPDINLDEGFYLAAADQMWQGKLLFVDVWDRKPVGIFILNFILRPLSSDGVWPVHIAALLCVATTAFVISAIAIRLVGPRAKIFPALIYLLSLPLFAGMGAQTPVFYNLFVVSAAYFVLRANDITDLRSLCGNGCWAMLLMGIAIQFKYTAIFEGVFFGLFLMYKLIFLRTALFKVTWFAIIWVIVALSPTILAFLYYAGVGHLDAFLYANFISIFDRAALLPSYRDQLLKYIIVAGAPLAALAIAGTATSMMQSKATRDERIFLYGWAIFAVVGLVSIDNFYDHYALPVIAPFAILAAPLFETLILGWAIILLLIAWAGNIYDPLDYKTKARSQSAISELAAVSQPYLKHGCMFIFDGPSILYAKTNACLLTRFIYSDHLSNVVEQNAIGADTAAETGRILKMRPAVIITADQAVVPVQNAATLHLVKRALQSYYVRVAEKLSGRDNRTYILNVRRDLMPNQTVRRENGRPR